MKHICKDCPDRSVEPSCRKTCKKWAEHEAEKAARYEQKQTDINNTYVNVAKERYERRNLMRRKKGW